MATFSSSDDLRGATFHDVDLRDARFTEVGLSGAVMRGVDVQGLDIDAPWLTEPGASLVVNGVDVAPLVEAELDRRFPGRASRWATTPDGLRAAWAELQHAWSGVLDRAAVMPAGTVDTRVGGEWSLAETLRHLVMATDLWLGRTVLEVDDPHPLGLSHGEVTDEPDPPSYDAVLAARADRVARVGAFLGSVTADDLGGSRTSPWPPPRPMSVLECVHVIINEEWQHLRFAVRDLDQLAGPAAGE